MIAGVGVDLVDIEQFASLVAEPGTAFVRDTFTPTELAVSRARRSGRPEQHLAARYAAKEALVKALSAALAPAPLPVERASLLEAEVLNDADGRPTVALSGRLRALAERAGVTRLHLSLSHDASAAVAYVVLERSPEPAARNS